MFRRAVIATLVLVLLNTSGAAAFAPSKTTRVKTPKGTKSNLAATRNPNTGDVLITYESKGGIYTALAKRNGAKFKAKKAKIVSAKDGNNHRPSAAWDETANEFIVSWDTGPESLLDASDQARVAALEPSDILSRRIKRQNGKGLKPVITNVSDGNLNIGPRLLSREDAVTMFFTSHDLSASASARNLPSAVRAIDDMFRAAGGGEPQNVLDLIEGLIEIGDLIDGADGFCLWFTSYLARNPTAYYALIGLAIAGDIFDEATPSEFDEVITYAAGFILDRLGNWVDVWREGPPDDDRNVGQRAAQTVWFEVLDDEGRTVVSPRGLGSPIAFTASNPIRVMEDETARAMSDPLIAAAASDGKARLFEIASDGSTDSIVLFTHNNDIGEMKLLDLEDGRLMVVFIREKNAKNDEIWTHVFDLPTGGAPRTQ